MLVSEGHKMMQFERLLQQKFFEVTARLTMDFFPHKIVTNDWECV